MFESPSLHVSNNVGINRCSNYCARKLLSSVVAYVDKSSRSACVFVLASCVLSCCVLSCMSCIRKHETQLSIRTENFIVPDKAL
jgi:hypothetical protein